MAVSAKLGRLAARWLVGVVAVGLIAGVAGCQGRDDEFVPLFTSTPYRVPPKVSPTPSSSPSPSWPVRAADDPEWTANQLAAVRVLDAYEEVQEYIWGDAMNADTTRLAEVVYEPLLSNDIRRVMALIQLDRVVFGGVTTVSQIVEAEEIVDGRPEIVVYRCQEDDPGSYVTEKGVERPTIGNSREEWRYVVQWVEVLQKWMVVDRTPGRPLC